MTNPEIRDNGGIPSNPLSKTIKRLHSRRIRIIYILCEKEDISHPEILIGLIYELRSITKVLKTLEPKEITQG